MVPVVQNFVSITLSLSLQLVIYISTSSVVFGNICSFLSRKMMLKDISLNKSFSIKPSAH